MFEQLIYDDRLNDQEKIATALRMYYGDHVQFADAEAVSEAIAQMLWFYRCGEPEPAKNAAEPTKKYYSFYHDAQYIYESFRQAYGIDLSRYLHWWHFQILFRNLPEDTIFAKIIGYRSMKISSKLPKEQKEFYRKMKRLYALPQDEADGEAELNQELESVLMNGGDPSEILSQMK